MKILHTGDWHIGRTLNAHSLLADQRFVLEQLMAIIREEKPDVLLIAGDLYDRAVPPKEAVALADEVLTKLVLDMGLPTLIIGGNHDGRERLDFVSGVLKNSGLYVAGAFHPDDCEPIILGEGDSKTAFWLVPFIKPNEYRSLTEMDKTPDYNEMYRLIVEDITAKMDASILNVLMTHGLVLSGMPENGDIDDSVRPIEIGGISYADSALFDPFDYVALGHLHRPQKAGRESVRYAGSLLKYSFSEVNQKKSVTLIDMEKGKDVKIKQISLPALHDMRVIEGELDELTAFSEYIDPNREDYIKVVLTNARRVVNPMAALREVYPNILEMTYQTTAKNTGAPDRSRVKANRADPMALFNDFYDMIHGVKPDEDMQEMIKTLMEQTEVSDHAAD